MIGPHFQNVQECDWSVEYPKCLVFAKLWLDSHAANTVRPKGVQIAEGRMYCDNKLCVPTSLTKAWIREHHAFTGHIGAKRLWLYLREHFEFFDMGYAEKFTEKIMRQCETCQATQRIHRLVGPMEATPMPHRPMQHVALDLFFMTPVKEGDKVFDMMAVCV